MGNESRAKPLHSAIGQDEGAHPDLPILWINLELCVLLSATYLFYLYTNGNCQTFNTNLIWFHLRLINHKCIMIHRSCLFKHFLNLWIAHKYSIRRDYEIKKIKKHCYRYCSSVHVYAENRATWFAFLVVKLYVCISALRFLQCCSILCPRLSLCVGFCSFSSCLCCAALPV